MPLIGGFVFPHGAIVLDPDTRDLTKQPAYLPTTKENCLKLHAAMKSQAEIIVNLKPDLIIVSTPHGIKLNNSYVFHGNNQSSGNAEWNGEWKEFTADIKVNGSLATKLVTNLTSSGNPVELVAVGDTQSDYLPLRWAEVVPWWFIEEAAKKAFFTIPPSLIVGQPTKRIVDTQAMIPELLKLGNDVWNFIKSYLWDKRVVILISCDLSHCHSKDPTSPYEFNENAVPFDGFCVDWSKIDIDRAQALPDSQSNKNLIKYAGDLVNPILSCGYTGLVLLQGILTACASDPDPTKAFNFKSNFLEYSWPTYYGMLICNFVPETKPFSN